MAYEQRDMSGTLFLNDKKKSDKEPGMRGTALIDGVLYEVASWKKEARNGGKAFLSLSFKPKDAQGDAPRQEPKARYGEDKGRAAAERFADDPYGELNDEIPF